MSPQSKSAGLNDPSLMRLVGLGLAGGQLEQADRWLSIAAGVEPRRREYGGQDVDALVRALEHLRSACGWLWSAARA